MKTTIVTDGISEWAAKTSDLIAALERLNWRKTAPLIAGWPVRYDEPCDNAYTELCQAIAPIAGDGAQSGITESMRRKSKRLLFRPDLGEGAWELT